MTNTKDDSIPVFYWIRFRWKISHWRYRKTCSTLQHVGRHRSPFCLCPSIAVCPTTHFREWNEDVDVLTHRSTKRDIILEELADQTSSGESVLWWVSDEKRRKDETQSDVGKTHTHYRSMTRICAVTLKTRSKYIHYFTWRFVAEHHIYILIELFFLIESVVLLLILSIYILSAIIYSTRQIVHDQDSTIVDEIFLQRYYVKIITNYDDVISRHRTWIRRRDSKHHLLRKIIFERRSSRSSSFPLNVTLSASWKSHDFLHWDVILRARSDRMIGFFCHFNIFILYRHLWRQWTSSFFKVFYYFASSLTVLLVIRHKFAFPASSIWNNFTEYDVDRSFEMIDIEIVTDIDKKLCHLSFGRICPQDWWYHFFFDLNDKRKKPKQKRFDIWRTSAFFRVRFLSFWTSYYFYSQSYDILIRIVP